MKPALNKSQLKVIDSLVRHYEEHRPSFIGLLNQLKSHVETSKRLSQLAHSIKSRTKDPEHLRAKLIRKVMDAKKSGLEFSYTKENLFQKINDLAGFRILHLHTRQIEEIHAELVSIFEEQRWLQYEVPSARTWDDESEKYFESIGIKTTKSETMYTSVHYIVQPNLKSGLTCEIQVRTLMEEVWGEVDHKINYPVKAESLSCREQIKVLARVTSSCSRLVDSIFLAHEEATKPIPAKKTSSKRNLAKP